MTSKLTRERLEEIRDYDTCVTLEESAELARMALAAMDSEPMAEVLSNRPGNDTSTIDRALPVGTQLYRHAQPVPVVPEEKSIPNTLSMYAVDAVAAIAEVKGWNACRAAMLQELKKSAGTEAICRGDENVQVLHTKSPAQSDCCPAQNHVSPEQNGDVPAQSQGWIPVSEQNPDCWCLTCRPVTLNDMRFVVCPNCGNKRCPRANDHRNACTGSNEPGQEGSAYPDTLQEPKP
ncbi:TPA: hypothetical protein L8Q30_004623 [Klebsiella pneumoniae]|nr:hypothetical protein [Klebsiella pneumoniae]